VWVGQVQGDDLAEAALQLVGDHPSPQPTSSA
jgi:hypothetical protein